MKPFLLAVWLKPNTSELWIWRGPVRPVPGHILVHRQTCTFQVWARWCIQSPVSHSHVFLTSFSAALFSPFGNAARVVIFCFLLILLSGEPCEQFINLTKNRRDQVGRKLLPATFKYSKTLRKQLRVTYFMCVVPWPRQQLMFFCPSALVHFNPRPHESSSKSCWKSEINRWVYFGEVFWGLWWCHAHVHELFEDCLHEWILLSCPVPERSCLKCPQVLPEQLAASDTILNSVMDIFPIPFNEFCCMD